MRTPLFETLLVFLGVSMVLQPSFSCFHIDRFSENNDSGALLDGGSGGDAGAEPDAGSDTESESDTCSGVDSESPNVISSFDVTVNMSSDSYLLIFDEDVINVDFDTVIWWGPTTPINQITGIDALSESLYNIEFSGLTTYKDYYIEVTNGVTDLCGNPLDESVFIKIVLEP